VFFFLLVVVLHPFSTDVEQVWSGMKMKPTAASTVRRASSHARGRRNPRSGEPAGERAASFCCLLER
jgi:hypothetical protein